MDTVRHVGFDKKWSLTTQRLPETDNSPEYQITSICEAAGFNDSTNFLGRLGD